MLWKQAADFGTHIKIPNIVWRMRNLLFYCLSMAVITLQRQYSTVKDYQAHRCIWLKRRNGACLICSQGASAKGKPEVSWPIQAPTWEKGNNINPKRGWTGIGTGWNRKDEKTVTTLAWSLQNSISEQFRHKRQENLWSWLFSYLGACPKCFHPEFYWYKK